MISEKVQDAIRCAVASADFRPLFEYFAQDIELRVAVFFCSQYPQRYCGRNAVISRLRDVADAGLGPHGEPVDCFVSGERVVALRDRQFSIGLGVSVHSECAMVFDIDSGLITRLSVNYEVSAEPQLACLPSRHEEGTDDRHDTPTVGVLRARAPCRA